MALKACPHCGHSVSDQAALCPQCGKDPRYTDAELKQMAVQRQKKRKHTIRIAGVSVIAIFIVLCAIFIPYFLKLKSYNAAKALFDEGYYSQAVLAFDELGNYKDSVQKALDARYQYADKNRDRRNPTTLEYLECLIEADYPNSSSLSDEVYKWTGVSYATRCENGYPSTTDFRTDDPLYFYIEVSGGKPDEEIDIQYRIDYYVSANTKQAGFPWDSDYETLPYKLKDGESAYVCWESGIGTSRYGWITITFSHAGEALSSTEVRIRNATASSTDKTTYTIPDTVYPESIPLPDDTYTDITPDDIGGDVADDTTVGSEDQERTVRIYNSETGQWEWVAPSSGEQTQEKDSTPKKKQKYVCQYNSETDTWDWMWVDDD